MTIIRLAAVIVLVAAATMAARAESGGLANDDPAAKADDIPPALEAAEIRLVKARLRQLEEKVAREERAYKALAVRFRTQLRRVKCHRPQHVRHHCKRFIWRR